MDTLGRRPLFLTWLMAPTTFRSSSLAAKVRQAMTVSAAPVAKPTVWRGTQPSRRSFWSHDICRSIAAVLPELAFAGAAVEGAP